MYAANGLGAHVVPMYEAQVRSDECIFMTHIDYNSVREGLEIYHQRLGI